MVKPPEDLHSISMRVVTAGGYGKGGREFACTSNWTQGSFLRFHQTVVVGEVDDPAVKKLSFELRGIFKNALTKEVGLGIATIETNPKQKARQINVELMHFTTNLLGDKQKVAASPVCKIALTLFHNRFPIDLSPDEVAIRHKRELMQAKEAKVAASGPAPHEYSFLLTRKINWDSKKPASFSKDTEHLLDEDVYKNLKTFQKNKKEDKEFKKRRRHLKNKFAKNQPQLSYIARKKFAHRASTLLPYRVTTIGVGYVGERVNPAAFSAKEVILRRARNNSAKINIPFSQKTTRAASRRSKNKDDPLDSLYYKMLTAEERRLKKLKKSKREASHRANLHRVRAKIIQQKKLEQQEQDEKMRTMVHHSDAQLKALRVEINRRKRRIAFLGMQKHLSEAEARAKAAEEAALKEKKEARAVLEKQAAEALASAHRSRSPTRSDTKSTALVPAGPKNAIPLRRVPDSASVQQRKKIAEDAMKAAERRRLQEEAKASLAQQRKLSRGQVKRSKPMPVEKNRVPLREVNLAAIRSMREQMAEAEAAERQAMALAAAMEAESLLRERSTKEVPQVQGVVYHNPFPVRKVITESQPSDGPDMGASAGADRSAKHHKSYDFAGIGKLVESIIAEESSDSLNASDTTLPYTYTLKTGTMLRAASLKDLQAKILAVTRSYDAKRVPAAQKQRAIHIKTASDKVASVVQESRTINRASMPVKINKNMRSWDSGVEDRDEEDLIDAFSKAMGDAATTAEKSWLQSSKKSMDMLTSRSTDLTSAAKAVEEHSIKMSQDDSFLRGDSTIDAAPGSGKTPGFLAQFNNAALEAAVAGAASTEGSKKKKDKKSKKEKTASDTAREVSAAAVELAVGLEKMTVSQPLIKTAQEQEEEDLALLKKQLQAQGVTVDAKMEEVMQSLRH